MRSRRSGIKSRPSSISPTNTTARHRVAGFSGFGGGRLRAHPVLLGRRAFLSGFQPGRLHHQLGPAHWQTLLQRLPISGELRNAAQPLGALPAILAARLPAGYNNYPAAAMVPQMIFGLLGTWLHAPQLGLLGYLLVLTIAVLTPAVWAARGARGLERMVVFVVCGAAAIPAWMVLDRANSVALLAPVGLVFLVALCRRRWGLVAIMVVLATLIKPQFAVLAVVLFAARQWRMGGVAVAGAVTSSLAAYLLWPRDFPATIAQSIHSTLSLVLLNRLLGSGTCPSAGAPADSRWGQGLSNGRQDTRRLPRWSAIAGGICRAGHHRHLRAGSRARASPLS